MSFFCFAVNFSLVQQFFCNTIEQFLISGSGEQRPSFPSFRMNPDDGDAKLNCFLLRDSHVLYFNSYLHERRWRMFGPCLITRKQGKRWKRLFNFVAKKIPNFQLFNSFIHSYQLYSRKNCEQTFTIHYINTVFKICVYNNRYMTRFFRGNLQGQVFFFFFFKPPCHEHPPSFSPIFVNFNPSFHFYMCGLHPCELLYESAMTTFDNFIEHITQNTCNFTKNNFIGARQH